MKKIKLILLAFCLSFVLIGCSSDTESDPSTADGSSGATSADGSTSASVVPEELVQTDVKAKGFSDAESKKVLMVVGDPRSYSVLWDMVNTAVVLFEESGFEVEVRDLYTMEFNPVLAEDEFYNAKDGAGEPTEAIKTEQDLVTQADHIIFAYPNWHDTPIAIVKGYMEKVFAKQFAYKDTDNGLEGLLVGKDIYTIMNAGFLGGGRGDLGDGVGIDDAAWDNYMSAFKVFDDDTAGFWGVENRGRFVNDRTPKNNSEDYEAELNKLREDLKAALKTDFNIE
ncbi:MAG: NAD(P)H-dependent oxidoreductase [Erysipelotrichaceae bacterium]